MPYTRAQLATEALRELGAVSAGETPSTEDQAVAFARAPDLLARVVDRRLVENFAVDSIPDRYFSALSKILAEEIAPVVAGRPSVAERIPILEAELIQLNRRDRDLDTFKIHRAVLAYLEGLGQNLDSIDRQGIATSDTTITSAVWRVVDDLAARRVYVRAVPNLGTFTEAELGPFAVLIAANLRPGAVPPAAIAEAEERLRKQDRLNRTGRDPLELAVFEAFESMGGVPPAFDYEGMPDYVDRAIAELSMKNIAHLSRSTIGPDVVNDLARYIASRLVSPPRDADRLLAERGLRQTSAAKRSLALEPVYADYY